MNFIFKDDYSLLIVLGRWFWKGNYMVKKIWEDLINKKSNLLYGKEERFEGRDGRERRV